MYFFVTIPAKTSETYYQPRFRMTNDEKNSRVKLHNIYMFPPELSGGVLCLDVSTVQYSTVQYSGGISTDNTQDGRRSTPGPASAAAAGLR